MPRIGLPFATRYLLTLLFFLVLIPGTSMAAEVSLYGKIFDEEKAPLSGAEIILVESDSRALLKSIFSDVNGEYRFSVKPGKYELRYRKEKYTGVDSPIIIVSTDTHAKSIRLTSREWSAEGTRSGQGGDCD